MDRLKKQLGMVDNFTPSHEEHCEHSFKRYGVRGDDIHSWMDEPSSVAGGNHRHFRHDINSIPIAIKQFGQKYGADMVENIFLDHLKADSEEERLSNKTMMAAREPYLDERLKVDLKLYAYKRRRRVAKVSFNLRKGWELLMTIKVLGGNKDVSISGIGEVAGERELHFCSSGHFEVDNSRSWWTGKTVELSYHVECGMAHGRIYRAILEM